MKKPVRMMTILLAVMLVMCIAAMTVVESWTRQGDDVRFRPASEWSFGRGYWDGVRGTGGRMYHYGFFERVTGVHPPHYP